MLNDTIVAPATNIQTQAISIIRISGSESFSIVNNLISRPLSYERGIEFKKLKYKNNLIDEVVVNKFIDKNSFTGEDTIEINCHGSVLIVNKIISIIIKLGARLALPGEFTQRAFLNGKINLIQAEAVNDLIHASNELANKVALKNLDSKNNAELFKLKNNLLDMISKIQVSIDYPDYDDVENSTTKDYLNHISEMKNYIQSVIKYSKLAHLSQVGIPTVIIGNTNAGKSSLLNFLINEDKAIVSDIEGTTRDIVEGVINLKNTTLKLIDTAGIRDTENEIEKIGIQKAIGQVEKAELILFLIDGKKYFQDKNSSTFNFINKKEKIIIVNKTDLLNESEIKKIKLDNEDAVFISVKEGDISDLLNSIESKFNSLEINFDSQPILSNANQIATLELILEKINQAQFNFNNDMPIDIIAIDLQAAWNLLNNLLGETYDDEILDNVFRKYCLGK